jgi:hypothetical protein
MDLPSWVEKHQLGSLLEMGIRGGRGILHVEQFRFHNSAYNLAVSEGSCPSGLWLQILSGRRLARLTRAQFASGSQDQDKRAEITATAPPFGVVAVLLCSRA